MTVTIEKALPSLFFPPSFHVRRVVDTKMEASGFATATEAREWAESMGHEVVE